METLSLRAARRLALVRAGLLRLEGEALPLRVRSGAGRGQRARAAALAVVDRFGYLQLDTVSIAGARSHAIVLLSRLEGLDPCVGEELLTPGAQLFEYWGHEASWLPLELYPAFEFRRRAYRKSSRRADVLRLYSKLARRLKDRIRDEGGLRSLDMEGRGSRGWWDLKPTRLVAASLWSVGELAISERSHFQRTFDLVERVVPQELREAPLPKAAAFEQLLLRALDGHGWATTGTLARTWRLVGERAEIDAALERLREQRHVVPCALALPAGKSVAGWVRPQHLELAARAERLRPRVAKGVLLSPFDPLLWDRPRVAQLFGFDQVLEIFKPAGERRYGYYCLPVLAGERLIARYDLKADRRAGRLRVLARRFEETGKRRPPDAESGAAARSALERYADALGLALRASD